MNEDKNWIYIDKAAIPGEVFTEGFEVEVYNPHYDKWVFSTHYGRRNYIALLSLINDGGKYRYRQVNALSDIDVLTDKIKKIIAKAKFKNVGIRMIDSDLSNLIESLEEALK